MPISFSLKVDWSPRNYKWNCTGAL